MRLATVDVGTNTAQLLVAEHEETAVERIHAEERFVRLGEGVDANGRIGPAGKDRLLTTLREYAETARSYRVDSLLVAGTSALRDATNRSEICSAVLNQLGLSVDILSGAEEAAWSFAAACSAFDSVTGPCLVVDIGGGSTELVVGEDPTRHHPHYPDVITDRTSLSVGCVRLTERCFASQPPSADAVDRARGLIDEALISQPVNLGPTPTLIGTAGTATALALVHTGPSSTWDALHGERFSLSRDAVSRWRARLLQLSVDEILDLHPEAMEGRADVFPVGVLLLNRIMDYYDLDTCHVSPFELRHGLALRALASASPSASVSSG